MKQALLGAYNSEAERGIKDINGVHSKALDDLVNVNSILTMAVFVGLSFASPDQHS